MEIRNFDLAKAFLAYPEDYSNGKTRPLLIIKNLPKSIVLFNITSKYRYKSNHIKKFYFPLNDWHELGLRKMSWIDTYRRYNIMKPLPNFSLIGSLSIKDIIGLNKFIHSQNYDK